MGVYKGQQPNVFRAVSGSLFSSPINWSKGFVPTGSDVATIADDCIIDINRTIGGLVVRSPFTASINTGLTLQVNDTVNVMGHLSCSGNPTINVLSRKNSINSLSPGNSLFFFSSSAYDQTVPGVTYNNVWIGGSSVKRLSGNVSISGSLTLRIGSTGFPSYSGGGVIDAYLYDLTVSGSTLVDQFGATFRKSGPGRITFIGNIAGTDGNGSRLDLVGNPIVEFRNGIVVQFYAGNSYFDSGQGQWIFTTNNQSIEPRYVTYNNRNTTIISGAIDVTVLGGQARSTIVLSGLTNGTDPNSRLINSGSIFLNYAPSPIPMATGSFIYNASGSARIGFVFDGNYQLPYSSYPNLSIGGSGIKSFPAISSSISASSFNFVSFNNSPSIFDISASNFHCGPMDISIGTSILRKTGPGNVTINSNIFMAQSTLDFRGGNPSVTFTGNLTNGANAINGFFSGTGSWYFPSPEQSVAMIFATLNWNGPLLISGTLKFEGGSSAGHNISASINGINSSARLINSGTINFITAESVSSSFATGSPDFSFVGNTINLTGNYSTTIPTTFNRFSNLTISGTGIKTMSTSSVISGSLSMGTTGALELGNNNLILLGGMSGPNDFNNRALFSKSGPGSILFAANIVPNCVNFNLPGNPTVEFRNGANLVNVNFFNFGTGSVIFSTNNQTFQSNNTLNFSGSLIVSGGITLTLATFAGGGRMDIYNTINGTTGSSVLVNNTTMYFYNSSSYTPMATSGTFSYLNPLSTLGYVFNGTINLPYTQYHSLIVGGTGSKFLSGDTYLSGSFTYDTNGILDCSIYALTVSGSFGNPLLNTIIRKNNNIGKLSFYGNAYTNGTTWQLTGNPEIEFRNGLRVLNSVLVSQSFGTGSMVFSQNNQIIAAPEGLTFANPITVSGSINLSLDGFAGAGSHIFSGSINGTEANSRLTIAANGGTPTITYLNPQRPMLTGSIDFTSSLNTFVYGSGSQDIRGGVYRNLTFLNGLKTLQGNVSVLNTFSTGSGATSASINLNGFTLTNP